MNWVGINRITLKWKYLCLRKMKYRRGSTEESSEMEKESGRILKFCNLVCSCFRKGKSVQSDEFTLLPPTKDTFKKTLVLDLDETLVHSSLVPVEACDYKVEIDGEVGVLSIYILIRPWLFEFLEKVSKLFEIVIYTASLKSYADPVIEFIDRSKVVSSRLFRTECLNYNGSYIKNLSQLGRDLKKVVIVDNSPISYAFHPHNAIAITSWYDDLNDRKLKEVYKILKILSKADNIPKVLKTIGNQELELSPKNIAMVMDSNMENRSSFNSPKSKTQPKFSFINASK